MCLLVVGLADEHRPLELGEVAVDVRRRPGDEDVALLEAPVGRVAVGQRGHLAADEPRARRPRAPHERDVLVAERVEHRAGGLQGGALAHRRGVGSGFREVRQVPVGEVPPAGRLPDEVDLGVGLRVAHPLDPVLGLDLDELRERGPLVAHRAGCPVGVGEHRLDAEVLEHPRDGRQRLAARVVEVVVHRVDPGVGLDALDLEPRDRDLDALGRDREADRPLGLDVVEAREVGDARGAEPGRRVGVGRGQAVPDGREPALVLGVGEAGGHAAASGASGQKGS